MSRWDLKTNKQFHKECGPSCCRLRRLRVNFVFALTNVYIIHYILVYYNIIYLQLYLYIPSILFVYFTKLLIVSRFLYKVFLCPFCSLLSHIKYYDSRTNRLMLITEIPHNRVRQISNLTTCPVYVPVQYRYMYKLKYKLLLLYGHQ